MHVNLILNAGPLAPVAYLDPGSGSIIVQLVIAAILGLGIFARAQWSKIKKLFGKKSDKEDADSEE